MLSEWQQKIKEKFDEGLDLEGQESDNFIKLLKNFHAGHGINAKDYFSALDLLQEGGWFYVKTKDGIDMLIQMCSYSVINKEVDYIWVEFNKAVPNVKIEINYKEGPSKQYELLTKKDIVEFYP